MCYILANFKKAVIMNIDPFNLAKKLKEISGEVALSELPNLSSMLEKTINKINYTLKFSQDEQNRAKITGKISTKVTQKCNRCLGCVENSVDTQVLLYPITSESEEANLPEGVDSILVDKQLNLKDILEEEVILALPLVSRHDSSNPDCKMHQDSSFSEVALKAPTTEKRPFAQSLDLIKLKIQIGK